MAKRSRKSGLAKKMSLEALTSVTVRGTSAFLYDYMENDEPEEFLARLWEELKSLGLEDPKLTVLRLGSTLASRLRSIYHRMGGEGDGYNLVEAYQKEYQNRLESGETAKH